MFYNSKLIPEDGYWEDRWANGQIHSKGFYKNGLKQNCWEYYLQGKLQCRGYYKNSNPLGYWENYLTDGFIEYKEFYF